LNDKIAQGDGLVGGQRRTEKSDHQVGHGAKLSLPMALVSQYEHRRRVRLQVAINTWERWRLAGGLPSVVDETCQRDAGAPSQQKGRPQWRPDFF
jgi:hypothetical protein